MKRKEVIFQSRKRFAVYTAALVICGLAIGVFLGVFMQSSGLLSKSGTSSKKETVSEKEYDITECVTLGKYSGREISLAATEDDIQSEIDNLLEENTTYVKIKNRKAKNGDTVYARFDGYVDGEKVDTACGSDYIEIGSEEWLEGFEDAVIGMKPGETKKFSIQVPEGTYGDDAIDGKKVTFRLKLKYICGDEIVPEYNDEFVEGISEYKTTEEYNAYLKEQIEKDNEDEKEEFVWTEVQEDSTINEYPESLMESARTEILNGYYDMADLYGVSHDEIFQAFGCEDEQDFKDTQLEDLAKDTAKEVLVAEAVAYEEDISYSTQDYNSLLKDEYESYSDMYNSQEEFEEDNKDYLEHTALIEAVKAWISDKTTYQK